MTRRMAIFLFAAACAAAQTAPAPARPVPSYKDLKYPPLPTPKIPEPAQITLSNGMRVFLLENHELPLISGTALVRTGNLFDPPDKRGLSGVMAEVMRSGGTKTKTGDQIDEELENIAGAVESSMGESSATVSFNGLKESADKVLETFKDVLTSPEFRQEKIDLTLQQARSAIARRNDEPGDIPDRELSSIIYGRDTPYGWQIEYTDVANIHQSDLRAFYQRYYFPKNIMLEVYGDFNTNEMKAKLEKLFADWKVDQPPVAMFPPVTAKPAPGIYLGTKEDVTQTFFAIGELGGLFRDPDYAALEVAASIFGEGFQSRLMTEIRTKLGYAYSIGAGWAANYDHPGTFRIVGSTKSKSTTETLEAINRELEKMRTTEVTPQELKDAKDRVLNAFVFNFDSPAKTLNRVVRYDYFGYPKDFLLQYQKAIGSVTAADVLRVSKQHFLPENLATVLVGNPKDFGEPLTKLTSNVKTLDLTIPEPKQQAAAGDAASQARGKAMLERAAQAMGGAEALAAVKDSTETLNMAMDPSAGGMKMQQVIRILNPSQFREDEIMPIGTLIAYTDGKTGWLSTPQGVTNMQAEVLKQAQGQVFRNVITLMLSTRDASRVVNAVGPNSTQISSANGFSVKVDFDPATGLPASETYRETAAAPEVVEQFADWRQVGALKMPFKGTLQQGGRKMGDVTVTDYKFNSGLKPEDLSKKP